MLARLSLSVAFSGSVLCIFLCLHQTLSAQNFDFRAVNLVDGLKGIDVHFFDIETATIDNLKSAYASKVQSNLPSRAGSFNVKYTNAGAGVSSAFIGGDGTVQSGYEYTGIAYGSSSTPKLKILERNKSQGPAPGKTFLRVIHAASVTSAIDVHLGQDGPVPTFTGVAQDNVTDFRSVNAKATALIITEEGGETPITRLTLTAPLGSGTAYVTLIVIGTRNDLTVYALFDADETKHQLIHLEESSYTNVRVVHLRPRPFSSEEALDIYLNKARLSDAKVTDTLRYRHASRDFGPLVTDSFQIKFVPSGELPTVSVLTVNHRFANDTSYVVALTQFDDLRPTPIVLTRSPMEPISPGIGTTKARFVNATDFYGKLTAVVKADLDTFRFENISFRSSTEFRELPVEAEFSIELYRAGMSEPLYTGTSSTVLVPTASYLTIFALGNEKTFSVDILNESQSGLQPLATFDRSGAVSEDQDSRMIALQVAPNPTSTEARLSFTLERSGEVEVILYDARGRNVMSVPMRRYEVGEISIPLRLGSLTAGHYTCLVRVEGRTATREELLLVR